MATAQETNDGGQTYTYDSDVAGAALQQEQNPQEKIHKNVDANINKAAEREGLSQTDKNRLLDTNPNKADATEDGSADTQQSPAPSPEFSDKGYESDARTNYNTEDAKSVEISIITRSTWTARPRLSKNSDGQV